MCLKLIEFQTQIESRLTSSVDMPVFTSSCDSPCSNIFEKKCEQGSACKLPGSEAKTTRVTVSQCASPAPDRLNARGYRSYISAQMALVDTTLHKGDKDLYRFVLTRLDDDGRVVEDFLTHKPLPHTFRDLALLFCY